MKVFRILANREIRHLFLLISLIMALFLLLAELCFLFLYQRFSPWIALLTLVAAIALWTSCCRYFIRQDRIMEHAVSQIDSFLSGNARARIECDEEGELYRLFHCVNSLATVLNAQAANELREKEFLKNTISDISHQLKTPLTSMVGYLELLKKEELDDVARDYVDVISDKAQKLKEMIESLFSLAKASSGNIQIHPEPVELNMLIEQIFADMDDRVKESGLKFVVKLTDEDTKIYSDNTYFYRICQNLIENVLKYSAKGTRAFVRTYLKGVPEGEDMRHICIEITNTAGYFMDFTKDDIVERFARGDKERTSEGNGLGLAIVSTYAKALGGEFDIRIDCDQFKACLEFEL